MMLFFLFVLQSDLIWERSCADEEMILDPDNTLNLKRFTRWIANGGK